MTTSAQKYFTLPPVEINRGLTHRVRAVYAELLRGFAPIVGDLLRDFLSAIRTGGWDRGVYLDFDQRRCRGRRFFTHVSPRPDADRISVEELKRQQVGPPRHLNPSAPWCRLSLEPSQGRRHCVRRPYKARISFHAKDLLCSYLFASSSDLSGFRT